MNKETDSLFAPFGCEPARDKLGREIGIVLQRDLQFEDVKKLLNKIAKSRLYNNYFIIGDVLVYARQLHKYYGAEAIKIASANAGKEGNGSDVYNWRKTCERIPIRNRVYDKLDFTHYSEVGTLAEAVTLQERLLFLEQANTSNWSAPTLREEIQKAQRPPVPTLKENKLNKTRKKSSTNHFGPETGFERMTHAPVNTYGVILLFGILSESLGYSIGGVRSAYPTCKAIKMASGETIYTGFEFKSSNFKKRHRKGLECNLIVCWEHDWQNCPVEVLELLKHIN